MSSLPKETKRSDFVAGLKHFGFEGPKSNTGKHNEYMNKGKHKVILPNVHRDEIRLVLLKNLLDQAGISRDDWNEYLGR